MGMQIAPLTYAKLLAAMSVLVMVSSPVGSSNTQVRDCLDIAIAAQDTMAAFDGPVPAEVARIEAANVYAACYTPGPVDTNIIELLTEGEKELCSGGGSTVMGWSDNIYILGKQFHIANGPASSYYTWYDAEISYGGERQTQAEGYTRSLLNDITFSRIGNDLGGTYQAATWFFADIPMGGSISLGSNCLGPLVTSTSTSASGVPLGLPIIANVLKMNTGLLTVSVGGQTCLVPC